MNSTQKSSQTRQGVKWLFCLHPVGWAAPSFSNAGTSASHGVHCTDASFSSFSKAASPYSPADAVTFPERGRACSTVMTFPWSYSAVRAPWGQAPGPLFQEQSQGRLILFSTVAICKVTSGKARCSCFRGCYPSHNICTFSRRQQEKGCHPPAHVSSVSSVHWRSGFALTCWVLGSAGRGAWTRVPVAPYGPVTNSWGAPVICLLVSLGVTSESMREKRCLLPCCFILAPTYLQNLMIFFKKSLVFEIGEIERVQCEEWLYPLGVP